MTRKNALLTIDPGAGAQPLTLRVRTVSGRAPSGVLVRGTASRIVLYAQGGAGGYVYSLVSGSMPPGMGALQPIGRSVGTPTTIGRSEFVAQVQDQNSTITQLRVSIQVIGTLIPVSVEPTPAQDAFPYSFQFVVRGNVGALNYSVVDGVLPTGLSFTSDTLSGTPIATGPVLETYYCTVRAMDSVSGDFIDIAVTIVLYPQLKETAILPDAPNIGVYYIGQDTACRVDVCWAGGVPPYTLSDLTISPNMENARLLFIRSRSGPGYWALAAKATVLAGVVGGVFRVTDAVGASVFAHYRYSVKSLPAGVSAQKDGGALQQGSLQFNFVGPPVSSVVVDAQGVFAFTFTLQTPTFPHDASEYRIAGVKVLGARDTGWGAATGFYVKSAWAVYTSPGTIGSVYNSTVASQLTTALAHIQVLSQRLAALQGALTAHGLIGP